MRIVIGAAADNIGRRVAEHVLQSWSEAVLLVRNPTSISASLAAYADEGPSWPMRRARMPYSGSYRRPLHVSDWYQLFQVIAAAGADALCTHQIPHVVLVPSLDAGMPPGLGTVSYAGELEQQLNATGTHVVALRPGYFMENFLAQAAAIRTQGVVQYPYAEDHDMPFISVADIAAVAAHYLLHPQWAGKWTRNLMGPTNLTLPAYTTLLAQAWGNPCGTSANQPLTIQQTLEQWGLTAYAQQEMASLFQALGGPNGTYTTLRTAEACTPTSFQ